MVAENGWDIPDFSLRIFALVYCTGPTGKEGCLPIMN
jgi:hypothetical protein